MPEGPEILFFSIFLNQKFVGGKINFGNIVNIPEILSGEILEISSKGKLLFFKLKSKNTDNYLYMHLHLGISGWIMFKDAKNVKYTFKITKNNKEYNIYIEDKTRLSNLSILTEDEHNNIINKLGIDIFTEDFTFNKFKFMIKSKNMILASYLLKQELFCGIGNYIKNEVLYLGNLDINIKTNFLTDNNISELYKNILFVAYSCLIEQLKNSNIENLLPEYNKIYMPKILEVPYEYKIYKREYTNDGKEVNKTKVGGRDTYFVKK
jgi:formamidopyrimidine-DNA glycosylase